MGVLLLAGQAGGNLQKMETVESLRPIPGFLPVYVFRAIWLDESGVLHTISHFAAVISQIECQVGLRIISALGIIISCGTNS
jgi:hypothetical protein